MTPMAFPLGPTELIIILVIVVLLFGGSRLAGLGKSTGRALKEFKEETSGLRKSDAEKAEADEPGKDARATAAELDPPRAGSTNADSVVDARPTEVRKDA